MCGATPLFPREHSWRPFYLKAIRKKCLDILAYITFLLLITSEIILRNLFSRALALKVWSTDRWGLRGPAGHMRKYIYIFVIIKLGGERAVL
jgi:hypothetical protein